VQKGVNERYNKHKNLNLTWGESKNLKQSIRIKFEKSKFIFMTKIYMMQQEPPWLGVRFQSNFIFKIYRGVMQRKNYESSLKK
jgi:hypothetical protein